MQVQRTTQVTLTQDEVIEITKDFVNGKITEKLSDNDTVEIRGAKKNAGDFLTFKSTDSYEVPVLKED